MCSQVLGGRDDRGYDLVASTANPAIAERARQRRARMRRGVRDEAERGCPLAQPTELVNGALDRLQETDSTPSDLQSQSVDVHGAVSHSDARTAIEEGRETDLAT